MSLSDLSTPILAVNGYLWSTMKQIEPTFQKKYGNRIPFFPISDAASGMKTWENKPYIIYDRMFKMSKSTFYPIKCEHFIYYLKGDEQQTLEWGNAIQVILDRQDDAAYDINEWNRQQPNMLDVYFHHVRVSQSDRGDMGSPSLTRDFSTQPHYITQFVVSVDYHLTKSLEDYLS